MGDGCLRGWGLAGSSTVPVVERLLLVGCQNPQTRLVYC